MQPYFLPYLGYFQLIGAVDKFIIYDDVNFINKGWVNRNKILINGEPTLITVPLIKASQNKKINEIQVLNEDKWKNKLIRTIEMSYKKAPYYNEIRRMFVTILESDTKMISHLNIAFIIEVCSYLELNTEIKKSSSTYNNSELNSEERILDICKKENTKTYLNPIGGIEIYNRDLFEESDIKIHFLKHISKPYNQITEKFVPFLSILDILMYCHPEEIKNELLPNFELH